MLLRSKYFFYTFFFITSCVFSQQFRNASNYSDVNIYQDNNGVAVADYDLDGDLDIFIVGSFSEENNDFTWSRLLQNTNNGNFIDVTAGTGIEQTLNHDIILNDIGFLDLQQDFGDRLSASWGDFNNDSYPDLFLGNSNQSQLYQNNTDGTFTNITGQSGLVVDCDTCFVTSGLWLDYDIDGLLDLFVTDYHSNSNNKLYKNLGNGTFESIDLSNVSSTTNSFSSIVIYANDDNYPDIYVVSDEIYEHINYVGGHASMAQFDDMYDRTITVNGVSKAFAMTGWRIGYIGAPEKIARACNKMQGQITSGANCIAQRATITALMESPSRVQYMIDEFKIRRDLILGLLNEIEGFKTNVPEGAFYVFPNISYFFGKTLKGRTINNASDFSMYLLEEALVATVDGESFGNPDCIRISYAASQEQIVEAIKRIKEAVC